MSGSDSRSPTRRKSLQSFAFFYAETPDASVTEQECWPTVSVGASSVCLGDGADSIGERCDVPFVLVGDAPSFANS